ncbi:MAG: sensor histidine kinase, partial [Verrucomicrobiota bacterium]
ERRHRRRCEEATRRLGRQLFDAGEDARHRVGRLLHEELLPRMAGLERDARQLEDAHRWLVPELVSLRARIGCLVRDLPALASPLHPARLSEVGLEEAVRRECQDAAGHRGGPVGFRAHQVPADLPIEVALGFLRVVQESLQNVRRHAQATRTTVELVRAGDVLSLKVEDNGLGFAERQAKERGHLGIISMRERLAGLGGGFHLHSRPGVGTRVSAWVRLSGVRLRAGRGPGPGPDRRLASGWTPAAAFARETGARDRAAGAPGRDSRRIPGDDLPRMVGQILMPTGRP